MATEWGLAPGIPIPKPMASMRLWPDGHRMFLFFLQKFLQIKLQ